MIKIGNEDNGVETCIEDLLRHNPNQQEISYQKMYHMIRFMIPNFKD